MEIVALKIPYFSLPHSTILTLVLCIHVEAIFPIGVFEVQRLDVGQDAAVINREVLRITHFVFNEPVLV